VTESEPLEELPEPLQETLRGLGGVRAPRELRDRVEMARLGEVSAPEELWQRVAPVVHEEAARRRVHTAAEAAKAGRLLSFPLRRVAALAAGLALLVTAGVLLQPRDQRRGAPPALAAALPVAEREAFLKRIVVRDVEVEDLSAGAREFAAMLGDGEEDDD